MSMVPKCVVCDRPVANPYAPSSLCERCKEPCPTCGGGVAYCRHELPDVADILTLQPRKRPDGRFEVAA